MTIAYELYNLNAGQLSLNNFGDFGLLSQNLTFSKELYVGGQMVPAFDIIMVIRSNPLHPQVYRFSFLPGILFPFHDLGLYTV